MSFNAVAAFFRFLFSPFVPFALLPVLGGLTALVWFPCADVYGRD